MSFKQINDQTPLGFIGLGTMGLSMAGHLLKKGHPMTLYTRTQEKAEPLLEQGAKWADSPKGVSEHSEVVISIVGEPRDVEQCYEGKNGVFEGAKEGMVFIDMTTSSPALAEKLYQSALSYQCFMIDAPVSGGDIGAREARLSIMVGGDEPVVDAVRPLFETMGKNIIYQGLAGSGQHTKLCNQIAVAGTMLGAVEALIYAESVGLESEKVLNSISKGAAGTWTLDHLAPRILKQDFDSGFYIRHYLKDLKLALEVCHEQQLELPGFKTALDLYVKCEDAGYRDRATQALYLLYKTSKI